MFGWKCRKNKHVCSVSVCVCVYEYKDIFLGSAVYPVLHNKQQIQSFVFSKVQFVYFAFCCLYSSKQIISLLEKKVSAHFNSLFHNVGQFDFSLHSFDMYSERLECYYKNWWRQKNKDDSSDPLLSSLHHNAEISISIHLYICAYFEYGLVTVTQ